MKEQIFKISWFDSENSKECSLTGTKTSVESIAEAVTLLKLSLYEGFKDVKIEQVRN